MPAGCPSCHTGLPWKWPLAQHACAIQRVPSLDTRTCCKSEVLTRAVSSPRTLSVASLTTTFIHLKQLHLSSLCERWGRTQWQEAVGRCLTCAQVTAALSRLCWQHQRKEQHSARGIWRLHILQNGFWFAAIWNGLGGPRGPRKDCTLRHPTDLMGTYRAKACHAGSLQRLLLRLSLKDNLSKTALWKHLRKRDVRIVKNLELTFVFHNIKSLTICPWT